jgi:hypothetical protein
MSDRPIYRWTGVDPRGEARHGSIVTPDGLAAFTEARFNRGWRELRVCAGPGTVPPDIRESPIAAIGPNGDGNRVWWAEADR